MQRAETVRFNVGWKLAPRVGSRCWKRYTVSQGHLSRCALIRIAGKVVRGKMRLGSAKLRILS